MARRVQRWALAATAAVVVLLAAAAQARTVTLTPEKLSPVFGKCDACKKLVRGFMEAYEKTRGGTYGGGNTVWENANLPKYDDSETRLAEISDAVCGERDETCHRLMGRYEDDIAEWWTSGDDRTEASLHQRLCIEREKACCPEFHGGPKCEPCPQDARGFTCGGHGACSYSGYRQKQYPYQCACSPGYIGRACEDCDVGYVRLPGETTCHKCHHTCKDSCTGVTELDCDECADGYYRTPTGKLCLRCNPACRTCTDATEDACLECAPGYARLDGSSTCVDVDECADTEHPACPGEGRQCINIPGAARCVCQPGYIPDGGCYRVQTRPDACVLESAKRGDEDVDDDRGEAAKDEL